LLIENQGMLGSQISNQQSAITNSLRELRSHVDYGTVLRPGFPATGL
jgi:hypothetical protein